MKEPLKYDVNYLCNMHTGIIETPELIKKKGENNGKEICLCRG